MIVDSNAYIGNWAFRRLHNNTAEGLLELMQRTGIDKACVSSASAIMYRDSHSGNEELAEQIVGYTDRLIPFAVLNPAYAGWATDLEWCAEVLGAKGLRLYPNYHNYTLDDPRCHEMVDAATQSGMLISIPMRPADHRQRHWMMQVDDVHLADIATLVSKHPEARFIVVNGLGFSGSRLVTEADKLPPNYWIETSRIEPFCGGELKRLKDTLGAERLVFGSGMCFKYPEVALMRLDHLDATDTEKQAILGANLLGLLGQ